MLGQTRNLQLGLVVHQTHRSRTVRVNARVAFLPPGMVEDQALRFEGVAHDAHHQQAVVAPEHPHICAPSSSPLSSGMRGAWACRLTMG